MKRLILAGLVCIGMAASAVSWAGDYPSRPITFIVPYAAGGSNDVLSRVLAEHMSKTLGQPMVIENEPGAAGTTATTHLARAAADGYAVMMGNMGTHAVAVTQYPALKYDPVKDFTPIGVAADVPAVIVTRPTFPADDLKQFIAYIKSNESTVNEANVGVGSPTHTFCTLLQSLLGTKTGRIPYKGGAQAMNDLLAGHVDFSCISLSGAISHIRNHSLKAMAIASKKRAEVIPDVPTTAEAGLPEFVAATWNAIFAPRGLSPDIQLKLNGALRKALEDESVRARLTKLGFVVPDPSDSSPEALKKLVAFEVTRWAGLLKSTKPPE
jgi:tripartite-type tricarboxylate transporter receptor subunit TctC